MSQTRYKASNLLLSKENKRSKSKGISPKLQKRNPHPKEKEKILKKDLRKGNKQGSLQAQFHCIDLWPKVEAEYFRPLTKEDKEILSTFITDSDVLQENECSPENGGFKDYENIFSESYQKIYLHDHIVSEQLSQIKELLSAENTTSSSSPEISGVQNDADLSPKKFLRSNQRKFWLDTEIENQQEILRQLNCQNKQQFLSLEKFLSAAELTNNSLVKSQREVERECLKNYIINLEDQQAAESLQSVKICKQLCRTSNSCLVFPSLKKLEQIITCVNFDEALSFSDVWIDSQTLSRLDKLREIANLSIDGFKPKMALLSNSTILKSQDLNDKETLKASKKNPETSKQNLCHFCKAIFTQEEDDLFIACRYRSSRMGPPQHDPDQSLALLYMKEETFEKDRKQAKFDKMGVLSSYQLFEGEKFCARKFCEACLRQEFDIDIRNLKNRTFWKCPFCKGKCNCSRCQRNTQIKALLQMYLKIDGDPLLIKEQTCFGKYLSQCDLKNFFKNNQTPFPDDICEATPPFTQKRHPQVNDKIGHTLPTFENSALNRDKRRLNRALSIENELPKKRIHKEIEVLDQLVIAIDKESEQCFIDLQDSPIKIKPFSQKKAQIKQGHIKQNKAMDDDKENLYWDSNKLPEKRTSKKTQLLKENNSYNVKQRLPKKTTDKEKKVDMKSSPEVLSKEQLDIQLFEDYCTLRFLFEIRFGDDEEEKEKQDFSKVNKKKNINVIELE